MGAVARELLEGRADPPEPLGELSPDEATVAPITREWIEREETFAYVALHLASGCRIRLARTDPGSDDEREELQRIGKARETAAKHLDALRLAGALNDRVLIEMAQVEGIELWPTSC